MFYSFSFYSPPIEFVTAPSCVRAEFYYHMWGDAQGKLEVTQLTGSTATRTTFFTSQGDQGQQWRKAEYTLNSVPSGLLRVRSRQCLIDSLFPSSQS